MLWEELTDYPFLCSLYNSLGGKIMNEYSLTELLAASAHASAHFAETCLEPYRGHYRAISSFVTPEAEIMHWHEFGDLEGPGWAANAVGGAHLLYRWGKFCSNEQLTKKSFGLLMHVLEDGFIDESEGFIWPYFDLARMRFCWNYVHGMDWLCPGSLAKIGVQLLEFAQDHPDDVIKVKIIQAVEKLGEWLFSKLIDLPNGWLPRRITPQGVPYPLTPDGKNDPIFDHSADGLYILQLWSMLAAMGKDRYRAPAEKLGQAFIRAGGYFGSINHDTYDSHESVAYACAFRILIQAAHLLELKNWRDFAINSVLPGLGRFRMLEDRHRLPTQGLLWMEESWNTAYLWENAEAAQAYLEAWDDTSEEEYLNYGLGIMKAVALHHHGDSGFLTEGVDWDNHVSSKHHIDGKEFEDIRYTEPLLNNLHILLPTLFYFEKTGVTPPSMDVKSAIELVKELALASRTRLGSSAL
jgi:hypothetical protein